MTPDPGRHRLDARRAGPRVRARRGRLPRQAGGATNGCARRSHRCRARSRGSAIVVVDPTTIPAISSCPGGPRPAGWRVLTRSRRRRRARAGASESPGGRAGRPADARHGRLRVDRAPARRPRDGVLCPIVVAHGEDADADDQRALAGRDQATWRRRAELDRGASSSSCVERGRRARPRRRAGGPRERRGRPGRRGQRAQPASSCATCSSTRASSYARRRGRRRTASPGSRATSPDLVLMDLQLPGHGRHEALRRGCARTRDGRRAGRRPDRFRDERRPRAAARARASTAISSSRSTCGTFPEQVASSCCRRSGGRADERAGRRSWSSTTCRRTCACSRPCSSPRGYRVVPADSGAEALAARERGAAGPRAARHPDAGDGRLRGLPPPARRRPRRASCRS